MRYHFMPVRMASIKRQNVVSVGKDVDERESLCPVGGKVNWYNHCGKQHGGSSKN